MSREHGDGFRGIPKVEEMHAVIRASHRELVRALFGPYCAQHTFARRSSSSTEPSCAVLQIFTRPSSDPLASSRGSVRQ